MSPELITALATAFGVGGIGTAVAVYIKSRARRLDKLTDAEAAAVKARAASDVANAREVTARHNIVAATEHATAVGTEITVTVLKSMIDELRVARNVEQAERAVMRGELESLRNSLVECEGRAADFAAALADSVTDCADLRARLDASERRADALAAELATLRAEMRR